MPFVILDYIFDRDASFFQSCHHLIRLRPIHARILRALRDEERNLDLIGVQTGEAC